MAEFKGTWKAEEDEALRKAVERAGDKNWMAVAREVSRALGYEGSGRTAKQCRGRYMHHLKPGLKRGPWTWEEEETLVGRHQQMGNSWSKIAKHLPGRTETDIKNHWNCTLRKKMPWDDHHRSPLQRYQLTHGLSMGRAAMAPAPGGLSPPRLALAAGGGGSDSEAVDGEGMGGTVSGGDNGCHGVAYPLYPPEVLISAQDAAAELLASQAGAAMAPDVAATELASRGHPYDVAFTAVLVQLQHLAERMAAGAAAGTGQLPQQQHEPPQQQQDGGSQPEQEGCLVAVSLQAKEDAPGSGDNSTSDGTAKGDRAMKSMKAGAPLSSTSDGGLGQFRQASFDAAAALTGLAAQLPQVHQLPLQHPLQQQQQQQQQAQHVMSQMPSPQAHFTEETPMVAAALATSPGMAAMAAAAAATTAAAGGGGTTGLLTSSILEGAAGVREQAETVVVLPLLAALASRGPTPTVLRAAADELHALADSCVGDAGDGGMRLALEHLRVRLGVVAGMSIAVAAQQPPPQHQHQHQHQQHQQQQQDTQLGDQRQHQLEAAWAAEPPDCCPHKRRVEAMASGAQQHFHAAKRQAVERDACTRFWGRGDQGSGQRPAVALAGAALPPQSAAALEPAAPTSPARQPAKVLSEVEVHAAMLLAMVGGDSDEDGANNEEEDGPVGSSGKGISGDGGGCGNGSSGGGGGDHAGNSGSHSITSSSAGGKVMEGS